MSFIGSNTEYTTEQNQTNVGILYGIRYEAATTFNASSMSMYAYSRGGINSSAVMGIYSDVASKPASLLGQTGQFIVNHSPSSFSWYDAGLLSPVSITAGTNYWLATHASPGNGQFGEAMTWGVAAGSVTAPNEYVVLPAYTSTMASTFEQTDTLSRTVAIYAVGEEVVPISGVPRQPATFLTGYGIL